MTVVPLVRKALQSAKVPVPSHSKFPINRSADRNYRIWNAKAKCDVPYRSYVSERSAHEGCVRCLLWVNGPLVLELYNTINGRLLGQYRKHANGDISIWQSKEFKFYIRLGG